MTTLKKMSKNLIHSFIYSTNTDADNSEARYLAQGTQAR